MLKTYFYRQAVIFLWDEDECEAEGAGPGEGGGQGQGPEQKQLRYRQGRIKFSIKTRLEDFYRDV